MSIDFKSFLAYTYEKNLSKLLFRWFLCKRVTTLRPNAHYRVYYIFIKFSMKLKKNQGNFGINWVQFFQGLLIRLGAELYEQPLGRMHIFALIKTLIKFENPYLKSIELSF